MPLVAYSVSAEAMCQLQFWAAQENYREYQNALWTVGAEILRADNLESNVFNVFLDWLSSEYGGLRSSSPQAPFSLEFQEGFIVFLVVRPQELRTNLRAVEALSANRELLRNIPALYAMEVGTEEDFVLAQTFLNDALKHMADRDDETLVIASR